MKPRAGSYAESAGIRSYYCGGEMFYERLRKAGQGALCHTSLFPDPRPGETEAELAGRREGLRWSMLSEALRCYMVGAALRSLEPGWETAFDHGRSYSSAQDAKVAACGPHTMLIHPSARKEDHFSTAIDVVRFSMSEPGAEAALELDDETAERLDISSEGLARRLDLEEPDWSAWLGRFEASRIALSTLPQAPYRPISIARWPEVRSALVERVFPNLRLRVLNSDPASDDRPRFEVEEDEAGGVPRPCGQPIHIRGRQRSLARADAGGADDEPFPPRRR